MKRRNPRKRATPRLSQPNDFLHRAIGAISPALSVEAGLAEELHYVLLAELANGERWSLFTADIAMGEIFAAAAADTGPDERFDFSPKVFPWVRRGWPDPVARAFGLLEPV